MSVVRERVRVRGTVQGVGFRPFVFRLASELALDGWVRNDAEGVQIEVQGEGERLEQFARRLGGEAPPLARVEAIEREPRPRDARLSGFAIAASAAGLARTAIPADAAPCDACLAELFDPANRRHRYPFLNCTHCGPRYTISTGIPYDRPATTMAGFEQCPECLREYHDPRDRRFHAQPNACPACGPRLLLWERGALRAEREAALDLALRRLRAGAVVAIKGVGGFHLACDARNREAVATLRARKDREAKPFAVMFRDAAAIEPYARVGEAERRLLESVERPIVLLDKSVTFDARLPGVAPNLASLGCMLPAAPLHYLLFAAGLEVLVMTSANPGGEPLVTGNDEALERLAGIADAFLMHDRGIALRCDDSIAAVTPAGPAILRRGRGHAPRGLALPGAGPAVLACGAMLKNAVCLTRGRHAYLSAHVGDLDDAATCGAFEAAVAQLTALLEVEPRIVAHDLHPDFHSTSFALELAQRHGIPALGVQHHHAHIAAVCAEHGVDRPVVGLALDGVGLGTDGHAWGGELLWVNGAEFRRLGHLRELPLAGADRAAREPWRLGAAVLAALGRGDEIGRRFGNPAAPQLARWLAAAGSMPTTSSAGRWFDAAAALLGVREVARFEGQAAMELEGLAHQHGAAGVLEGGFHIGRDRVLDLLPLLDALCGERDAARGAALFHDTLVEALARWALAAAAHEGLSTVALGGGCFANRRLATGLARRLAARGIEVLHARQAPCNDGGIALGQAWVALHAEVGHVPRHPRPHR